MLLTRVKSGSNQKFLFFVTTDLTIAISNVVSEYKT